MRKVRILLVLVIAGLSLAGAASATLAPTLDWSVFSSGGHAVAGTYTLDVTIGQSMAGAATAGGAGLCAGFQCGAVTHAVYLPVVRKG